MEVNRDKYIRMIKKMDAVPASLQQQALSPSKSADFERFKFWLGLPNNYYSAGSDWRDR